MHLANQKILFVTGKGGVGKSMVAAGAALARARRGERVLLVEIGENSYYKDFWRLPAVGHEPLKMPLGFDLALWSGESCLREYVLYYLKMERLYRLFFENKVMRSLINVAPGLSEIAILGKITSGVRGIGPALPYDSIIVDTYATGHALAMFRSPKGMMEAIKFGPMGHNSREILGVLKNPKNCRYWVATLLEELPVVETLELREKLMEETGLEPEVVSNKVLRVPVGSTALEAFARGGSDQGLTEFTTYLRTVVERQGQLGAKIRAATSRNLEVPLIFSSDPNELVSRVADALGEDHD